MLMPRIMLLQTLATWPLPGPPACTTLPPTTSRKGLAAGEGRIAAADHHGQRGGLRARQRRPRPAHRPSDGRPRWRPRPPPARWPRRWSSCRSTACRAWPWRSPRPAPAVDRPHVLAGRQHGEDDLGVARRLAGALGNLDPGLRAASTACGTGSKPITRWPALTRFFAMGPPMLPRPMKPMSAMPSSPKLFVPHGDSPPARLKSAPSVRRQPKVRSPVAGAK